MNADRASNGTGFSPNRLYRSSRNGMIAGVCAGIADYFGIDVAITRVLVVLGAMFFFPFFVASYVLLAILLPKRPFVLEADDEYVDPVQRRVRLEPHDSLGSVRHRFRGLNARLQRLEKYVTSKRFGLDREFERLRD